MRGLFMVVLVLTFAFITTPSVAQLFPQSKLIPRQSFEDRLQALERQEGRRRLQEEREVQRRQDEYFRKLEQQIEERTNRFYYENESQRQKKQRQSNPYDPWSDSYDPSRWGR